MQQRKVCLRALAQQGRIGVFPQLHGTQGVDHGVVHEPCDASRFASPSALRFQCLGGAEPAFDLRVRCASGASHDAEGGDGGQPVGEAVRNKRSQIVIRECRLLRYKDQHHTYDAAHDDGGTHPGASNEDARNPRAEVHPLFEDEVLCREALRSRIVQCQPSARNR